VVLACETREQFEYCVCYLLLATGYLKIFVEANHRLGHGGFGDGMELAHLKPFNWNHLKSAGRVSWDRGGVD
jgi:hypothetical protein